MGDTDHSEANRSREPNVQGNTLAEMLASTKLVFVDGKPISSWRLLGRMEGRAERMLDGKVDLLSYQITHRFGVLSTELQAKMNGLSTMQVEELSFAVFNFRTLADVASWLEEQN